MEDSPEDRTVGQMAGGARGAPGRRPRGRPAVIATVVVALVAAVVVAAGVVGWPYPRPGRAASAARPVDPTVDQPAPALSGRTLAGGTLDLADLRGSVVLVTVWAAWCAPCRAELPVLVDAERRLGPRGLRLVGIDHRDGERQARELLAQTGGDPAGSVVDPDGRLADAWRVQGVPQTFVVDAGGTVRASVLGAVTREWVDRTVAPLLADAGPLARGSVSAGVPRFGAG